MGDVRLETPRVTVLMDTGEVFTVQVLNPDYLRWDRTAAKHGWPPMAKAPHTWLTFVAWSALRRTGVVEDTWEEFSETRCMEVRNAREDAPSNGKAPEEAAGDLVGMAMARDLADLVGADGVDPTPPDPGPD